MYLVNFRLRQGGAKTHRKNNCKGQETEALLTILWATI